MRSVLFFILSVTLHAAALMYPVDFADRNHREAIRVSISPEETEPGGGEVSGNSAPKGRSNAHSARLPTAPRVETKTSNTSMEPPALASTEVETVEESTVSLISTIGASSDSSADFVSTSGTGFGGASGNGGSGNGGNGFGPGTRTGNGSGVGLGSGASGSGATLTQARYRDTPRPEYPESARRQGREGSVLLRVLVDDQGRSKQVEINRSSGSDALDRAAAEAIKRWRFHPARHGERPVESWLRIPIEFRLTDANVR